MAEAKDKAGQPVSRRLHDRRASSDRHARTR